MPFITIQIDFDEIIQWLRHKSLGVKNVVTTIDREAALDKDWGEQSVISLPLDIQSQKGL